MSIYLQTDVKLLVCSLLVSKKQPILNVSFHTHVQVTFKVWRRANFVTFFEYKGLKLFVTSISFSYPLPTLLTLAIMF